MAVSRENPDIFIYNVFGKSASKLTNFLTQSHRSELDANRCGLEVRGLVVWDMCLNLSITDHFWPEHHCRDIIYRNAHLMHQIGIAWILPYKPRSHVAVDVARNKLIIYCFTSRSRIFHLYGDVTIAGEGRQNSGLCSALLPFEQGRIFIVPHLLWHGTSVFQVSSDGPPPFNHLLRLARGCGGPILTRIPTGPHLVASYDTQGDAKNLF
jgi:hypothetical protein